MMMLVIMVIMLCKPIAHTINIDDDYTHKSNNNNNVSFVLYSLPNTSSNYYQMTVKRILIILYFIHIMYLILVNTRVCVCIVL